MNTIKKYIIKLLEFLSPTIKKESYGQALHNILANGNMNITGFNPYANSNPVPYSSSEIFAKCNRTHIELIKAENGGFIISIQGGFNPATLCVKPTKIYINKEIENLGVDIQNALMLEIMNQ